MSRALWEHTDTYGDSVALERSNFDRNGLVFLRTPEQRDGVDGVFLDRAAAEGLYDALRDVLASTPRPCEPDCKGYADYAAVPCPNPACADRVAARRAEAAS